jgi:hypothetical protein
VGRARAAPASRPGGCRPAPGVPRVGEEVRDRPGRAPSASSGERPPSGGGWRTWNSIVRRYAGPRRPCGTVHHRGLPRPAGPRPGRRERTRRGHRRRRPRRLRMPGRPCRTRLRLPGGSARCTRASRREVEGRAVVRHVGRRPEVRRRKEPGRPRSAGRARSQRRPSRRSRSPGEGGDRSRRARGRAEDGVRRLAAAVAHLQFGQARACAYLGGGGRAPRGSRAPDSTAGHRGPGRGRRERRTW